MIVCKICGFDNEPGAQFCGSCGGFLEWTGETAAPETPPGTTPRTVPPPPPTTPGIPPVVQPEAPTTAYQPTAEPVDPGAVICPSCGLANERDRVFCRRCAAELVPIPTEPIGAAAVSTRRALPVPTRPAIAAVVGIVAIIAVGVVVAGVLGGNDGRVAAASSTPSGALVSPSAVASQSAPPSVEPSPSPVVTPAPVPTGRILFASDASGNAELMIGEADGSGIKRLLKAAGNDVQPAWSRDGKRIAYASKDGIRIINADGTKGIQFTNHDTDDLKPEWSPKDDIIVFTSRRDGDFDLYFRHVAKNDLIRLTNSAGNDYDPSWSVANDLIAFISARDGGNNDVWTMKPDGKGLVQLTDNNATEDDPAWSPDGTKIAFSSDRDGEFFIYVMNADGSDVHRLSTGTVEEHDPTWSPDGLFIAFARYTVPGDIAIVSAVDGTEIRTLGEGKGRAGYPAWEPAP